MQHCHKENLNSTLKLRSVNCQRKRSCWKYLTKIRSFSCILLVILYKGLLINGWENVLKFVYKGSF